jgi:hypothetical protein
MCVPFYPNNNSKKHFQARTVVYQSRGKPSRERVMRVSRVFWLRRDEEEPGRDCSKTGGPWMNVSLTETTKIVI